MTIESFILSKSYLPKNGTYTMMDHLQAMEMTVTGEVNKIAINDAKDPVKIGDKLDKINVNEPFSFTWKEKGKSYIISADLKGSTITVFGAIMNSSDSEDKLYPSVTNRANVEAPIINDENTN